MKSTVIISSACETANHYIDIVTKIHIKTHWITYESQINTEFYEPDKV